MKQVFSLILTLIIAVAPAQIALANGNTPPVATDDNVQTISDQQVTYNVLDNDYDPDVEYIYVSGWSTDGSFSGSLNYNGNGQFTYTPDISFHGVTSYVYWVNDLNGGQDMATVYIDVQRVNSAPITAPDDITTIEGQAVSFNVLTNDYDPDGDSMWIAAWIYDTQEFSGNIQNDYNPAGQLTYTPDPGFVGTVVFTYIVDDNYGGQSQADVTITVTEQLDVNNETYSVDEDSTLSGNVLTNDNGEGVLTSSLESQASNGTTNLNNDGTFTYTPNADFNGQDSFTYTVTAENGQTAIGTTTITVGPVNDTPVATDDTFTTDEDSQLSGDVLTNDSDIDGDTLQAQVVQNPTNGSLTLNSDGTFTYTPNTDFNGQDSFTYNAVDPSGATSTSTVTLTVNQVNDAPVAADDNFTGNEDTQLGGDVLANDTDVDDLTLQAYVLQSTTNGTLSLNANGSFTYTPNADFNGQDSFTYYAEDAAGASSTATVTLTISPVNDAPVASDDSFTTDEDTQLSGDVLANDTDVDGDTLQVTVTQTTINGSLTMGTNGQFSYVPNANFYGQDSFTYQVEDPSGVTSTATVAITVNSVNDAPTASFTHAEQGKTRRIDFNASNSSDIDGTVVTYHWDYGDGTTYTTTDPTHTYRYSSKGAYTVVLTVTDNEGAQATFTSTVNPG